jgi:hypothetical protein
MDEDDYGYEDYEASPYNGDDLDGGAHDEFHYEDDYYAAEDDGERELEAAYGDADWPEWYEGDDF